MKYSKRKEMGTNPKVLSTVTYRTCVHVYDVGELCTRDTELPTNVKDVQTL